MIVAMTPATATIVGRATSSPKICPLLNPPAELLMELLLATGLLEVLLVAPGFPVLVSVGVMEDVVDVCKVEGGCEGAAPAACVEIEAGPL